MAHFTHQCWSPTGHTATPDAVDREFNHLAIDLNRPAQDDPMDNQDLNLSASYCKTIVSAGLSGTPPLLFIGGRLMELSEGDKVYRLMKEIFVSRVAAFGVQATLVAIHQNCYSGVSAKGRAQAFRVHSQAVQMKGGENTATMKYAWYATSKEEVSKILSYGFGYSGKPENNGFVKSAPIDEDGLRHLLLCRAILWKSKLVSHGSEQFHPSLEQYDSGVDDLSSLRRFIVWSTHVNTHVLPEYIISFSASCRWRGASSLKLGIWNPPDILYS
ncbi:hypothetical protein NL676_030443 [Syzygium grande]|nr:hypothetical protein NL676_030443 [Syzygium grande]